MQNETTQAHAIFSATEAADKFCLPQTVYRNADSCGWWHTNSLASFLYKAEVFVTILPARYFQ